MPTKVIIMGAADVIFIISMFISGTTVHMR